MQVPTADQFYSVMGILTQEMLDSDIIDPDDLIKVAAALDALRMFAFNGCVCLSWSWVSAVTGVIAFIEARARNLACYARFLARALSG